jgi:hypothetical protein
MSATAISNPIIYSPVTNPVSQPRSTALRNELQQLGSDLKSGNLSAAQQDYVTLSQSGPLANSQSTNPLVQDLQAVGSALQSGNLTSAQQAFTTFQQAVQQQGGQTQGSEGHHHHHFHRGGGGDGGQVNSELSQAFSALQTAVQSGNTSSAQTALSTLQQDLAQLGFNLGGSQTGAGSQSTSATGGSLSVTA